MSRLVLVSGSDAFEQRLREALIVPRDDVQCVDPESALEGPERFAATLGDDVETVAVGPNLGTEDALHLARALDTARPGVTVVVVADQAAELWEQAMDAGVRAVLRPGAEDKEITETFERALETAARRRAALAPLQSAATETPRARTIVVLGPKGGAGKTMVAANLAVGLAQVAPDRVAVLDLDVQFGDLTSALQLVPEHTLAEAARAPGRLDPTKLKTYMTAHPSHLYALCAPGDPAAGEEVPAERTGEALEVLAGEFDWLVVDTGAGVDEHALAALERATDVVLLCTMDVASVRALRKLVDALDRLDLTTATRHVVLNRSDSRVGLSADDVEATLGLPVHLGIPSSRAVPESMNQGAALLEVGGRERAARQLRALVGRFAEIPDQRGGLLSGRRRR